MTAIDYANANREAFLEQLKTLLRIPSVSTLPEHASDVARCAEWVAEHLRQIGMTTVQVYPTGGHPLVYASWAGAPGAPTVLVYGHYDVQPVDPIDEWHSSPFEPTIRDGKLYARGSTDDKGQVFAQIKAVDSIMKTNGGKLPVNVKFLIEGEEEIGSENLDRFLAEHKDLFAADVCVISDGVLFDKTTPSVTYSVRGLSYMEIEVWATKSDLHSGTFGGTVHNPAQALCEIVAALHNPDGSVAVPGFYDKVRTLPATEREALAKIPYTEDVWRSLTGGSKSWGEKQYSLVERSTARPTLEVNGLISGFTGKGAKTVLPAKSLAKVSCRLVADQDPNEIVELVRAYVQELTPDTIHSEVRAIHTAYPASVPIDHPAMAAAAAAYQRSVGKPPIFMREGGTLPIVATLQQMFNMPVVMMGFGLNDDGAHGPNEKFDLDLFYNGINTAIAMLEELSKVNLK